MSWHGHLTLNYRLDPHAPPDRPRTVAHDRHDGPLRVLQRLYPEGDAICHHVLVHPPGGLVGGDRLDVDLQLETGSHALVTTPGATRFFRSAGETACQQVHARLGDGARLEWLPLETIAYDACLADNRLRLDLAPTAQAIGWDVLALGLPAAGLPWSSGRYDQRLEWPGRWLETAHIDARDHRLLDGPLGWAGQRVLGTLWFAMGTPPASALKTELLETARAAIDAACVAPAAHATQAAQAAQLDRIDGPGPAGVFGLIAGATAAPDAVITVRALAPRVEPLMALFTQVWGAWRSTAWGLSPHTPRIWRM
jgi:urease accessory protein